MDKKSPYRFTIKFNPNIPKQKAASDLLNGRPDKANYLTEAVLYYEQKDYSPTLRDIYVELQEIKQQLQTNPVQPTVHAVPHSNTATSDKKSTPPEIGRAHV